MKKGPFRRAAVGPMGQTKSSAFLALFGLKQTKRVQFSTAVRRAKDGSILISAKNHPSSPLLSCKKRVDTISLQHHLQSKRIIIFSLIFIRFLSLQTNKKMFEQLADSTRILILKKPHLIETTGGQTVKLQISILIKSFDPTLFSINSFSLSKKTFWG